MSDIFLYILFQKPSCSEKSIDLSDRDNIKLFGGDGLLDSIGLVGYIVEVEEKLETEFEVSLVLADEKAMSRRTSPFARISYLADYILDLINNVSNE
jgi:acyl carrier protein